jgi:hypothetical protein
MGEKGCKKEELMNLKSLVIGLSVCLNLVLGIMLYHEVTKEEPLDVGLSFKEAVRVKDYTLAKTLMAKGRKEQFTDKKLKKINEIMSAGTTYKTYQLLEFDNNEMVLLHLSPDDKYEIQDVVIVPEGLKSIFRSFTSGVQKDFN